MVSWLSIVCMFITLLIVFGFIIGLTVYMKKKQNISLKAVLVGALMFIVFQVITRIPLMGYIQSQSWYGPLASSNLIITAVLIAFSAALFETAGRYIGLKFLLKKQLERKNAIAYGIGHGGIEAIYLVGITYIMNIIASFMMNSGSLSGPSLSPLTTISSEIFLTAGVERFFTMLFHIGLSLLVYYGITNRKRAYILYCLLLHTIVDGSIIILQINGVSDWFIEACIAVIGILSLIFIIKSKNMGRDKSGLKMEV